MLFIWHKGAHIGLPFHLQFENLSSQEQLIIIHLPGIKYIVSCIRSTRLMNKY